MLWRENPRRAAGRMGDVTQFDPATLAWTLYGPDLPPGPAAPLRCGAGFAAGPNATLLVFGGLVGSGAGPRAGRCANFGAGPVSGLCSGSRCPQENRAAPTVATVCLSAARGLAYCPPLRLCHALSAARGFAYRFDEASTMPKV